MIPWLGSVAGAAVPFPASGDWQPLTQAGADVVDVANDRQGIGDDAGDLLGATGDAALQWDADADTVFLRMQLTDSADFVAETWAFLLDVDADPADFEYALMVEGSPHTLTGWSNTAGTPGVHVFPLTTTNPAGYGAAITGETRTSFEGGRFYVDLQLERAVLVGLGVFDATPIRIAGVSAVAWALGPADVAACDGNAGPCTDLALVSADAVVLDLDADGLTATQEARGGTDPADADSDDDGLSDLDDPFPTSCDGDGDGLPDGLERSVMAALPDTDPAAGCFLSDADAASATDPTLPDTDGGGRGDGAEDVDRDGSVGPWETDPQDPGDDADADGDGIPDVFDDLYGTGPDVDSDGDGVDDRTEGLADSDGDTVPDFGDLDSDADGVPDLDEGVGDTDQDGAPDRLDDDSDDDGVPDLVEGVVDSDGDTVPDRLDLDSDEDGVPDASEGLADTDGDTISDRLDDDSDDDGILDEIEGPGDTDEDGTPDFRDDDSDDDGLPDDVEGDDDYDGDLEPNFQDTDSDGDDRTDADEGLADEDCDERPDYLDADDEDSFCDTADIPTVDTDGNPPPDEDEGVPDPFAADGQFTGGSCSTAPGGAGSGLVLVLLLLVAARPARAQEVNAERFTPSVDGGPLVKVEDAATADAGRGGLGLQMDHADDPFVFRPTDGDPVPVLDAVTTARLLGWYSLGALRVGVDLPIHPYTSGYGIDRPLHPGDVRLSTKLRLLEPAPLGAALFADASLPTGAVDAWVGAGTLVARMGAIGTVDTGRLLASASVGARNGTGSELQGLTVSPAIVWGLGGAVRISEVLSASLEADGDAWLGNGGEAGAMPAEGLVSLRQAFPGVGAVQVGAGTGLTRGVGAPLFRLVAGFSWEPGPRDAEPEATPEAATPEVCTVVVRAVDPFGEPVPGATVRVLGTLGTPLATGADGLLEARLRPGAYEVVVAAEGWETASRTFALKTTTDLTVVLHPGEVRVEGDHILLTDKVFFEPDRAELAVASLHTLDPLAALLVARPELAKVRVEGHTDATGTPEHNLELSQARAEAVVAYLVRQGVPAERLEAKGLGEERLLQQGDSDEVHATNRRVEFHVVPD